MVDQPILHATDGAVATITLNRPDVLNALSFPLLVALREALEQAADDVSIRAVLITGAGPGFCAGADLRDAVNRDPDQDVENLRNYYHPVVQTMRDMGKPIVTAVNGVAAGAGMSIALAGDIVLAAQSAKFLQAFSRIALVPDAGSTWLLPRLVGDVRARALALLAEKISAEEALRYGLVWKVYPDAELAREAHKTATYLASMPTRAYSLTKRLLNESHERNLSEQLEHEAASQQAAARTEDFREGVTAFLEKRQAQFKGR